MSSDEQDDQPFPLTSPGLRQSQSQPFVGSPSRTRSISLPEGNLYPSPSSGFVPQPNEAEILKNLLSKDRARREAKQRKVALQKRNSASMLSSPASQGSPARRIDTNVEEDSQEETTPTKRRADANGFQDHGRHPTDSPSQTQDRLESLQLTDRPPLSRRDTPSRPSSSYLPYLPELDVSSSEVAKRLSISMSRRSSHMSATPTSRTSSPTPPHSPRLKLPSEHAVKIRDFAFDKKDPRHIGKGQPVRLRSSSNSQYRQDTLPVPEAVFEDSSSEGGLSSSGGRERHQSNSSSQYAWDASASGNSGRPGELIYTPSDHDGFPEDNLLEPEGIEIPPGGALYVACYEFLPEAAQEMRLDEGEVVKVFERLCEGWVVAGRQKLVPNSDDPSLPQVWIDQDDTGLVPETYLRRFLTDEAERAGQKLNDESSLAAQPISTSPK